MTRKQEITMAADATSRYESPSFFEAFVTGAEWADRSMITKACEWLEQNAYHYCDDIDTLHESALIGDFRHAMKGE